MSRLNIYFRALWKDSSSSTAIRDINLQLLKHKDSVHRTPCRTHYPMRTVCHVVLSGGHPSLTFHTLAWLKMKLCTLHLHSFLSVGTTCLNFSRLSILARSIPATIHNKRVSAMADVRTFTRCEPKDLAENDDMRVKPLFFRRPRKPSTYYLLRAWRHPS